MNWKLLCLLPGLTLAAVPAYANTNSNNQIAPSAIFLAQSSQQGDTMINGGTMMKKPGAMINGGTMMKKPGAMINGGTMMKKPGAMMNDGTMMKKPGAMMNGGTMMRMGSRGEEVKAAQSFLTRQGFYTGPINGIFDTETRSAVTKFQNSKKITPTGIIGPTTRAAMQF